MATKKKRVLEPTKYPGIKYDRAGDVYIVSLDFGRKTVVDPKTGQLVRKQDKTNKTCATLAEAKALKDEHDTAKRTGKMQGLRSKVTFDQACEEYFASKTGRKGKSWWTGYLDRQQIHRNRVNDYLALKEATNRPVRETSIRDIEEFFEWCEEEHEIDIPVQKADGTYEIVHKKYDALGRSTLDKLKSFLHGLNIFLLKDFDRYGVDRDIVTLAEVSAEKEEFEPTVLDAEQVNYLIRYALDFEMRSHLGAPLVNVVLGCLCGGMRRGEQLGVKWCDIQPPSSAEADDGRIHVLRQRVQGREGAYEKTPKGGRDDGRNESERKQRWVPLPMSAWTLLQIVRDEQSKYRAITDDDYVYQEPTSLNGNYLTDPRHLNRRFDEFQKRCNDVREKAGLEPIPHVRLHDLRHTFAGLLQHFDGSEHPEIGWIEHDLISYAMGHRTKGTTVTEKVYLHDNGVRTRMNRALDLCITTPLERHDYNNL